jgi:hypothetical protein
MHYTHYPLSLDTDVGIKRFADVTDKLLTDDNAVTHDAHTTLALGARLQQLMDIAGRQHRWH